MAKEQRDRDAADELIRLRKTPRYCGVERTSFRRMTKIEDCLTKDSQFENHRRLCQRSASRQRPLAIRSRFMSRARLEAENLLLRQQLIVLRRKSPRRVRLGTSIACCWYGCIGCTRRSWTRSSSSTRRPCFTGTDVVSAPTGAGNPEVAETTVGRYMVRHRRPPSQGWKTFLRNHAAGIASLDLFVMRSISFKLLYGLVILRHARRRLVAISVTSNPTAEWIAGHVTDAFPTKRRIT